MTQKQKQHNNYVDTVVLTYNRPR